MSGTPAARTRSSTAAGVPAATSSWVVTTAPAGGSNSTSAVRRSDSEPSVPTSGSVLTRSTTRIGTCWPFSETPATVETG